MEILNSVYLERNPNFLNIRKDKIRTKDGLVIDNYIVAESKDWVNAVVLTNDNQIILVKQYRHGIEQQTLEIPAGAIEEGESPEEAIIREVSEETGYTSNKPPIFLGDYYVNPANFNNSIFCYLITDAELKSEQRLDETEFIDVFKYSFKDIETLIESGELKQLFSVHSIRLVQSKLLKEEKSL